MKLSALLLGLGAMAVSASPPAGVYVNFVRQIQQGSGVVWDMQVDANGNSASKLLLETGGSLFQLWTINQQTGRDHLLDQKLVGAYLPKADITITTGDPYPAYPRTRVDQPFTVEITVAGLLVGPGLPAASTKVLAEQHIASYGPSQTSLDPNLVAANTPLASGHLTNNGKTILNFPASSLTAADSTTARGEEHFIVHALADGAIQQTQIASAKVQIWPVASGAIHGLTHGGQYRYQIPTPKLDMVDLYPRSDTFFMLYEGSSVGSGTATIIKAFPWESNAPKTVHMDAPELNGKIVRDGTYTVALVSTTVFGTELLCNPITFSVRRSIAVNAMQVELTDGTVN